jgi:hypothetical protein
MKVMPCYTAQCRQGGFASAPSGRLPQSIMNTTGHTIDLTEVMTLGFDCVIDTKVARVQQWSCVVDHILFFYALLCDHVGVTFHPFYCSSMSLLPDSHWISDR